MSTVHSSSATATSVLYALIAPNVIPWGRPHILDVRSVAAVMAWASVAGAVPSQPHHHAKLARQAMNLPNLTQLFHC
jgi:hypothetical protein